MSDDWREVRRDLNRGGRFILWWVLAVVAIIAIVGVAWWGIGVATSGVKGQGDGITKRNSAENWLDAQARFEENYAEYESTLVRIDTAYAAWQTNTADKTLHQTYLGTIGYCTSVVADYNADARNFLREDFRAVDLPESIDPATCKENPL
jgi:hypothetical protein